MNITPLGGTGAGAAGEAGAPQPVARPAPRCLVELTADAGLSGLAVTGSALRHALKRLGEGVLLNADPNAVSGLWEALLSAGAGSIRAAAALDIALWDLKAKARDEPLWKTLGGSRPRANVYLSVPDRYAADQQPSSWLDAMTAKHGFRGAKLASGIELEATRRRLAQVRRALLSNCRQPELMLDAGGRWPATRAVGLIRALEDEFDLSWIEEPAGEDIPRLRRISDRIRAAVCAGGRLAAAGEFRLLLQHRGADVVEIDIGACGITAALQIADAAYGYELPVTLAAYPGDVPAQLASALPYFMSLEAAWSSLDDGLSGDVRVEDGWAVAGDRAGHGLAMAESRAVGGA